MPKIKEKITPSFTPFDQLPDSAIIKKLDLVRDTKRGIHGLLGLSLSGLDKKIKNDPNFPKRVALGSRAVGFRMGDIRAYLASLEVKGGI